jgi:hypothetical protein
VNALVSYFVRHNKRALRRFANLLGEDRSALIVENGACAFQRRVAGRQPCQFKLEMPDGGIDQLQGLLWGRAARHLMMQLLRGNTDGFKRIHF